MKKKSPKKIFFKKENLPNILMSIGIFFITFISIATGTYISKTHDITVGSISPERFVADREVVNIVATEKAKNLVKEEAIKKPPFYILDNNILTHAVEQVQTFFNTIKIDKKIKEEEEKRLSQSNSNMDIIVDDSDLLMPEFGQEVESESSISNSGQPIFLTPRKIDLIMSLQYNQIDTLENHIINIVTDIMEAGVKEDINSITKSKSDIQDAISKLELTSEISNIVNTIASSVVVPNVIIDEIATQEAIDKKIAEVNDIMIKKGQKIVDKDEIITEEIYGILDNLGLVKKEEWSYEKSIPLLGLVIIICLLQAFVYEYIRTTNRKLWTGTKEKTMLFTMYCLMILIIRVMVSIQYYMIIPITILGMLVAVLIELPLAILLNIVISIVGMLIYNGDIQFLIYFIISGTFICISTKHTYERNNTIKTTLIISFVNAIVMLGIELLFEKTWNEDFLFKSLLSMLNGIITLIVMTGSLPFWEVAFDAITPIKLLELTNPNQPILKRLIIEAPGTYHHSIIVANLAEMAAMDISANGALARAGAYYHDIGKLKYPHYFSENQVGENPHDYLLPLDSAKIIIDHVESGYAYALNENLPKAVRDMIMQHHGNTLVKYFYYKAKKDFPDEIIKEEQYRYPGSIPQFKEAAIVMLADTVEAAVRSMYNQGKNIDEIKIIVASLIKDKLDDGQLLDSGLTIKDLEVIKNSFINVFKGMYHERIAYPKEALKSMPSSKDKEKEK